MKSSTFSTATGKLGLKKFVGAFGALFGTLFIVYFIYVFVVGMFVYGTPFDAVLLISSGFILLAAIAHFTGVIFLFRDAYVGSIISFSIVGVFSLLIGSLFLLFGDACGTCCLIYLLIIIIIITAIVYTMLKERESRYNAFGYEKEEVSMVGGKTASSADGSKSNCRNCGQRYIWQDDVGLVCPNCAYTPED